MATFAGLVLLFLFSVGSVAFGSDRGMDYIGTVRENPKEVAIRLAKLDLISYLLTSVPLVGGLMILLGRDPGFIVQIKLPGVWTDFATGSLGLIAAMGIGAGIARRRWALRVAASRQGP